MYLKSTDRSLDRAEIIDTFEALYASDSATDAFFEHRQWWICQTDIGKYYAVVDASGDPSQVCNGLAFEEI